MAMLKRRELLQLSGLAAAGYGVGMALRMTAPPAGRDLGDDPRARALLRDGSAPAEGPRDADVVLVLFTDYQCPACRKAAPALAAAMREDGGVRVLYRDWPIFGPRSEQAARVALAAGRQGLYAQVHHGLMADRRRLDPPVLRAVAEAAGGDWARLERDMAADRAAVDRAFRKTRDDAYALGIAGTPAYLIGSKLVIGAIGRRQFRRAFADARAAISG
ncbi:MAG: hypothetical protein ABS87_01975 [Sphingomonas sp. SCN 67-18]|nr:DsbA family protein [Sphingomonas sp. SCN 67-18]ODU22463.1 MAG: hypothetical protein ABS87_01975 [Sphingomonas sp. SCN 67-18]